MRGLMMDYPLTLDRLLEHARRLFPTKGIATLRPDGALHRATYLDCYKRIKRLSKALVKLGIKPGDRVGTFAWNTIEHFELYYAIPGAGAICHTLNLRLFPEQLTYIINHAEDKAIVIDASLVPLFKTVLPDLKGVEHFIVYGGEAGNSGIEGALDYDQLLADSDEDFEWLCDDESQAMGLCYTSGTTGDPKGALYSHRSMMLHTLGSNQTGTLGLGEHDVVLPVVPQFHAMAWGLPYIALAAGADLVMPGPHLKPDALADLISNERVTMAAGVPSIWTALYNELKARPRDISACRMMLVGGSAMPRALTAAFEKDFNLEVVHAWGMTELSPLGSVCRLRAKHQALSEEERWDIKARQGTPPAGVEMRIVDDGGAELPWDGQAVGELQVRGPWIIKAYYKREPSADNFTADGWFRTGDVASIDADGYMTITDRTKDLVKSGGEWISSVELENALMAHEGVLEAAVIAVPDVKWAERPWAVVVKAEGAELGSDELRDCLAKDFAKFWLPDRFVFLDEIPKTSVGKFDKKVLRRRHAEGTLIPPDA